MSYSSTTNRAIRSRVLGGAVAAGLVLFCLAWTPGQAAGADTTPPAGQTSTPNSTPPSTDAKPAPAEPSSTAAPAFDAKSVFRNICGFCHEDSGRKAGKGPQLMGTALTDQQVFDRIKFGKPGRMAAFGGAFTDDQIKILVAYIRALKPKE